MTDVVTIGNCTLYLGDALDIVSRIDKYDVLISDPPYGVDGSNGTIGKKRAKAKYTGIFPDTPDYIENHIAPIIKYIIERCVRGAITPGGTCSSYYPNPSSIGAYVQEASSGLCKWGACTIQPIFYYGRDPLIGKTITPISYRLNEHPPKINHPCPKPQKAWNWLVNKASIENEIVIDPFMGSGTTGISCVQLNRRFIGIELDKQYFNLACERIESAYSQGDLFIPSIKPKPHQYNIIEADNE